MYPYASAGVGWGMWADAGRYLRELAEAGRAGAVLARLSRCVWTYLVPKKLDH